MTDCLVDGQRRDHVPADDRGLLYGDGLFETIAFIDGTAPLWDGHMQRLMRDGARIGLTVPDAALLFDECRELAGSQRRTVIRLMLTRGSGGRAYTPPDRPECRRILHRRPWPADLARQQREGIDVATGGVRLASGPALAGMKHTSRLEQVLAARECRQAGADELLLFDAEGWLVEAVSANVVVVRDGQAATPGLDRAGVAGVGLGWLTAQPEVGISEQRITGDDVGRAEEIMVINSVAGIRPVRRLDDRELVPGPLCRRWQQLWQQRLF